MARIAIKAGKKLCINVTEFKIHTVLCMHTRDLMYAQTRLHPMLMLLALGNFEPMCLTFARRRSRKHEMQIG